jgi:hypothetical protein
MLPQQADRASPGTVTRVDTAARTAANRSAPLSFPAKDRLLSTGGSLAAAGAKAPSIPENPTAPAASPSFAMIVKYFSTNGMPSLPPNRGHLGTRISGRFNEYANFKAPIARRGQYRH